MAHTVYVAAPPVDRKHFVKAAYGFRLISNSKVDPTQSSPGSSFVNRSPKAVHQGNGLAQILLSFGIQAERTRRDSLTV